MAFFEEPELHSKLGLPEEEIIPLNSLYVNNTIFTIHFLTAVRYKLSAKVSTFKQEQHFREIFTVLTTESLYIS